LCRFNILLLPLAAAAAAAAAAAVLEACGVFQGWTAALGDALLLCRSEADDKGCREAPNRGPVGVNMV